MRATGPCPKRQNVAIRAYSGVRSGGGCLSVGDVFAGAFTVVSRFSSYDCKDCKHSEFYRTLG